MHLCLDFGLEYTFVFVFHANRSLACFDVCAGCHAGDFVGCEAGLVCGVNNCVKFHTPLQAGMPADSDCCEGKKWDLLVATIA